MKNKVLRLYWQSAQDRVSNTSDLNHILQKGAALTGGEAYDEKNFLGRLNKKEKDLYQEAMVKSREEQLKEVPESGARMSLRYMHECLKENDIIDLDGADIEPAKLKEVLGDIGITLDLENLCVVGKEENFPNLDEKKIQEIDKFLAKELKEYEKKVFPPIQHAISETLLPSVKDLQQDKLGGTQMMGENQQLAGTKMMEEGIKQAKDAAQEQSGPLGGTQDIAAQQQSVPLGGTRDAAQKQSGPLGGTQDVAQQQFGTNAIKESQNQKWQNFLKSQGNASKESQNKKWGSFVKSQESASQSTEKG